MSARPVPQPSGRFDFDSVAPTRAVAGDGCTELVLSGEIDIANCAHIPIDVEHLCRSGSQRIRVDMDAVTFIDCAGVHALMDAFDSAREQGCTLSLTRVRGIPMRVLNLLELDTVLLEKDEPPKGSDGRR